MKDKKLNFKDFLQENGVDIKLFAENCLKENHGWSMIEANHTDVYTLGSMYGSGDWVDVAFSWDKQLGLVDFGRIYDSWNEKKEYYDEEDILFGFTKYSLGDLYER